MLVDGDVAPGEAEVVIGGKQGDQAEGEAADRLGETEAIEGGPRRGCCWQFWRNRRHLAAGWRPGGAGGRGHGAGGGWRRGARASRDQCHQPAQIVTGPSCRRGFRPLSTDIENCTTSDTEK